MTLCILKAVSEFKSHRADRRPASSRVKRRARKLSMPLWNLDSTAHVHRVLDYRLIRHLRLGIISLSLCIIGISVTCIKLAMIHGGS